MKLNQAIINSEIESLHKNNNNITTTSPYTSTTSSMKAESSAAARMIANNYNSTTIDEESSDKVAQHLSTAQLQNKIYKGSPSKPTHQTSSSIGSSLLSKSKQPGSKSFHSTSIIPTLSSLSAQKNSSGEKPIQTLFSAQKISQVSVNGFSDESSKIGINQFNQQQIAVSQKETHSMNNIELNTSLPAATNNDTFKVYARVRPINAKEKSQQHLKKRLEIIKNYENTIYVLDPDITRPLENQREKSFTFDSVYADKDDNQKVYEGTIATLLKDHLLEGYNTTVFAYGQTGAGKTYTLFGDEYKNQDFLEGRDIMAEGIVSLIIRDLFNIFQKNSKEFKYSIKVSYLEIYNENIRDLLVDQGSQSNLMIVEDPQKGILIPELSEFQIRDSSELNNLIRKGNTIRVMASTHSNQFSSRSHCIISINIEKIPLDVKYSSHKIVSKLSLIDLAGSERAAVSENKGIRMMEGNCINILSDSKKQGAYVPYRDSKLTRLLKDSLGGTTKTVMIACIAPSHLTYEETLNTLKYAQRAKNIQNKIKQNIVDVDIHVSQYKEIIDNLKLEIESLRKQLNAQVKKPDLMKTGIPNEGNKGNRESRSDNSNNEIEELSNQIFLNIEENWEITQTLRDLDTLRQKNQEMLLKKQEEQRLLLKTTMTDDVKDEILKLSQEIQTIQSNMENNDNVFAELQMNQDKNNQQKKQLRDQIKQIVESNENGQEKTLEETCRLLQLEKMDLFSQNIEIKKEAQTLALEKEKTVNKLKQMEREMELMKQQLQEKDKIISKSSQIITQLKQKESLTTKDQVKTPSNLQKEPLGKVQQISTVTQPTKETKKSITSFNNLNMLSPQIQQDRTKKPRDKSVTNNHSENMKFIPSHSSQMNLQTQERTPIHSQNVQDIYYRPKEQNRQLSSNRQEQPKKRKKQSSNYSQTNLQYKTNTSSKQDKFQSPQQQPSNITAFTSVKQNYIFSTNENVINANNNNGLQNAQNMLQEDIKKEYYYFDQNKKLQKRGTNADDIRMIPDSLQSGQPQINLYKNDIKIDSLQQSQKKDNKQQNLHIDLDSLKKFDEIQKLKSEKKQAEIIEKAQAKQEIAGAPPKQKGKKKNKHKHNLIEEKITIDELKNYAQKLKDMDFDNVKIKPNLKKFQKNNENANNANKHQIPSLHQNTLQKRHEFSQHNTQNQSPNLNNLLLSQKFESMLKDPRHSLNGDPSQVIQVNLMEIKQNKQNQQQYEREINCIQDKITETQHLISSLKLGNEGEVVNDFSKKNNAIFEEYSNLDKNFQQKQQYYSKGERKKEKSADQQDFEKYLQEVTKQEELQQQQPVSKENDQQLVHINDISYMNKVADNSVDITIQDCLFNIEKAENNLHHNHFHLVLDPKQVGNKVTSYTKISQQQATPDKSSKLNLKSLEETRAKVRAFKHQLVTLNDKIKSSQVTPDIINQMKQLIRQYEAEQFALGNTDESILKEFRRILIVFKEYDSASAKQKISNNASSSSKQMQNLAQSTNPSSVNFTSNSSSNQASQNYTTRPRSINSISEEAALQNQYYQQNNFNNFHSTHNTNSTSNKRDYTNQSSQNNTNQNHSNNISVNKKQIEQGAFSKILNNYGEAAKVIHSQSASSSSHHNNLNNNSSNLKKYTKGVFSSAIPEPLDSARRSIKSISHKQTENRQQQLSRQNIDLVGQQQNSSNQSDILNSQGLSYIQPGSSNQQIQIENKKDENDSMLKCADSNKMNISSNMTQSAVNQSNSNNQANSASNRGKSVTSYVQINNKRKSFKEDTDKSANIKQEQIKQYSSQLLKSLEPEQNINQQIL